MKSNDIRRIISEMPESSDSGRDIFINIGKLLGIMLSLIVLTRALSYAGMESEGLLMLYFLGVLTVSVITPRYGYGIAAALIASFAYAFLTDHISGFGHNIQLVITLIIMLLVTLTASTMTIMLKHHAYLAQRREHRSEMLFGLGQAMAEAGDAPAIAKIATEYLSAQLARPAIVFISDPKNTPIETCAPARSGDMDVFFTHDEIARIHRVFLSGASDALIDENEQAIYYYPVIWHAAALGVAGIDRAEKPLSPWDLDVIRLICRQTAHALELQHAREAQNDLRIGAETEKTRGNLLSSISHDFRTPLTSILGASTAILEQKDMLAEMRDSLLNDIQENTKWLIRMVENILTVTQISQESMQLHKRLEAAEEVIAQSVSIVRGRFPDSMIHVKIPNELIMIPMDATLVSQVIINLLENAIKHSEEGSFVLLNLKLRERFALFEIRDHGSGIPPQLLDRLFEIHTQPDDQATPDAARGIGIGLSICRTIIQAHGGIIEGHNRKEGGAKFSFWLPLEDSGAPAQIAVNE